MSNLIEVQSVNKTYKRGEETLVVLDDLSLEVQKGDFLALMGPSGSGKSTLLNLIGGLDTPTSGQIVVNEQHLETMNASALSTWRADNVGFIFQFYIHFTASFSCASAFILGLEYPMKTLTPLRPRPPLALRCSLYHD